MEDGQKYIALYTKININWEETKRAAKDRNKWKKIAYHRDSILYQLCLSLTTILFLHPIGKSKVKRLYIPIMYPIMATQSPRLFLMMQLVS